MSITGVESKKPRIMKMTSHNPFIAVTSLSLAMGSLNAANIILNGDMESSVGSDLADWNELNGSPSNVTVGYSTLDPASGSGHGRLAYDNLNNTTAGGAPILQQASVPGSIDPASTYTLSFDAKVDNTDFTGVNFQVGLFLGGATPFGTPFISLNPDLTTTYQTFTYTGLTPGAGTQYDLQFLGAFGAIDDIVNGFNVDNVSLEAEPIPEPSALGLLAFVAALGMTRRRR